MTDKEKELVKNYPEAAAFAGAAASAGMAVLHRQKLKWWSRANCMPN